MTEYESLNEKYKKDFPKGTPLVVACEKGRVGDVNTFIDAARAAERNVTAMVSEVGKDSKGYSGWTPLMIAAKYEHSNIIEILLQCNADTATTKDNEWNALHFAAGYNNTTWKISITRIHMETLPWISAMIVITVLSNNKSST